ncbi:ABC transporter substrate-binding protein [Geodermatophilus sabuli]|uniref:NitT/TauT family transport system substrate-binding protein n=1 Tax=Geodermatophilus sabuli TaxID=1564158 RepID=A0A285EGF0_9ACTN|nr:ABC transporter substrate-binding protein [Geodermatophilus sabuli]MBB3083073.1 NitT/TauT family transport system substrate-binding protein [Geodermatophilus sabuli]SNX98070.1 NitT/TauT family transport system substrate-binding protein [Geodermatophilus sabuli]
MRTSTRARATSLAAALALLLTACGGDSGGEEAGDGGDSASGTRTVQVGIIPVSDVAILHLGQEQGFFAERGIELEFNLGQGGAALVPAVVTGDYQFGFSGIVSILQAREQGLPVTAIAPTSWSNGEEGQHINALMASDPAIQDAGDLEGKTVALNILNSQVETLARNSVEVAGGNPDNVNFVEMSLPDAVTALGSNQIQSFVCGEPFCTLAQDAGARVVADNWLDLVPEGIGLSGVYFSTTDQIEADPALFADIQAAIYESLDYSAAHPDEWRAQIPEYTEIDPALVERLTMPLFKSDLEPEEYEAAPTKAVEYEILGEVPTVEEFFWEPES